MTVTPQALWVPPSPALSPREAESWSGKACILELDCLVLMLSSATA